ncbi:RsmB/NOP family class I SAM-dependent RNA methyltransferase [Pontibaca salina]|uniref:RsmB/NOP family class I SAM-dependent RNA methyltransferase n=1 Tax=Pontibaca salina TaxID=2795731 RepID=A0A934HLV4_9RHOB|nr:RsmB/NOP family class I SAM-dependent RNA methyltransferase [Pontibaca salina]MBI6630483.1 RsmB/NOP family class I SAM-dependent RNA methyltransferase [Pontibaca salina]
MTPAARVQAAIEILDEYLAGKPAEQALTGWARRSRYAGSGDRAAVRDHVFDALRNTRSFAAVGGAMTGRGLMLGAARLAEQDLDTLFSGATYAPTPLSPAERDSGHPPKPGAEALDLPDWLMGDFSGSLGDNAEAVAEVLKQRAPVHLRVNTAKMTRSAAQGLLREEGITCVPHAAADTALEVKEGARRIRNSQAYRDGVVELQDAASQAAVQMLPLRDGMRVLDFCAGGGGKALAMAARAGIELYAHDADPARMSDLPKRAARAGIEVKILKSGDLQPAGPFDLVLCDVPCSGSGTWRRAPHGKWSLTPETLDRLRNSQAQILCEAADIVAPNGVLAYMTCSLLEVENDAQVSVFTEKTRNWVLQSKRSWSLLDGTDGFFTAHLKRLD